MRANPAQFAGFASAGKGLVSDFSTERLSPHAFGRPQDIEWAIEGDQLFLLQSPPIATLRDLADPEGALNLWDNSNITESYNGVTTPLTFSFARYVYEGFTTVALPRASGLKKPAVAQRK